VEDGPGGSGGWWEGVARLGGAWGQSRFFGVAFGKGFR